MSITFGSVELDLISLVGGSASIFGIIIAILIVRRGKRVNKVEFAVNTRRVVRATETIPDLAIYYDGQQIDSLLTTDVAIFNSGTETIRADEVSSVNPLMITIDDNISVYGVEIVHESRAVCNFEQKKISDHSILIEFEYMDQKDGCVLRIFHGPQLESEQPVDEAAKAVGTFQKVGDISKRDPDASEFNFETAMVLLLLLLMIGTPILSWLWFTDLGWVSWWIRILSTLTAVVIAALMGAGIARASRWAFRIDSSVELSAFSFVRRRRPAAFIDSLDQWDQIESESDSDRDGEEPETSG